MDNYAYYINGGSIPARFHTAVDAATVSEFLQALLSGTIQNYVLANFVQNDSDYVSGIKFFPIDVAKFISSSATLKNIVIGKALFATTNDTKHVVVWKNYLKIFSVTFSRYFNNFLDFEPYTRLKVYVPYFGFIEIPTDCAYKGTLDFYASVDFSTGNATVYVYYSNYMVTSKTAKISIDVPIGKTNAEEQQRNKVLHGLQAGVAGGIIALGVASGNPLLTGGAVAKAGGIMTNALNDNVSRLTSYNGGSGGTDSLAVTKTCLKYVERPSAVYGPSASVQGLPCRQTLSLSALSGYTKVGTIHFDPQGEPIFQDEMEEIVALLQKGVYL